MMAPQIMEVNSSPGLEGIETCTHIDVAGAIVDYMASQVDIPEIDIRQRLTLSPGYGVTEIFVPEGSHIVGKTIGEAGLWENDVNVLSVTNSHETKPNPGESRVIAVNDTLICFGSLKAMRELIPESTRKRRKPKPVMLENTDVPLSAVND